MGDVNLTDVLRKLHSKEQNVSISSFFEVPWTVKLGDEVNGFKYEKCFSSLDEAIQWLAAFERNVPPFKEQMGPFDSRWIMGITMGEDDNCAGCGCYFCVCDGEEE